MGNAIEPTAVMRIYSFLFLILANVVATETDTSEIVNPNSLLHTSDLTNDGDIDKFRYFKEIENRLGDSDDVGALYDLALAQSDPEAVEIGSDKIDKRGQIDHYGFRGMLGKRRVDRYSFFGNLGKRDDGEEQLHMSGLDDLGYPELLDDGADDLTAADKRGRMDSYAFLGKLGKRYRTPMGFRGTLGKRMPLGFRGQLGKRYTTPMSFHGQLGKRMHAPYGFIGQLGKRMRAPMGFIGQLGRRKRSSIQKLLPVRLMRGIDRYSFAARLGKRAPNYRYFSQLGKRDGEGDTQYPLQEA